MNKKIKQIINKKNRAKIISLTAYSKNIAQIIDKYVDMTLVGDSMASVLYNYNTTRQISLDTMIEHAKSVRMGVNKSLMVFDMPYNTYRNPQKALRNEKTRTTDEFLNHFSLQKLSDLPTIEELGSAGLIDTTNVESNIFGTGKFYKEKQLEKKENIYSDIDEMLSGTLKNEE